MDNPLYNGIDVLAMFNARKKWDGDQLETETICLELAVELNIEDYNELTDFVYCNRYPELY